MDQIEKFIKESGVNTEGLSLKTSFHTKDNLLDGITFESLITAIESNERVYDEKTVKKVFNEIRKEVLGDAEFLLRKHMKDILKELKSGKDASSPFDKAVQLANQTILKMMDKIEDNYHRKNKKQKMFHEIHPDIQKKYEKAENNKARLQEVIKMLDNSDWV